MSLRSLLTLWFIVIFPEDFLLFQDRFVFLDSACCVRLMQKISALVRYYVTECHYVTFLSFPHRSGSDLRYALPDFSLFSRDILIWPTRPSKFYLILKRNWKSLKLPIFCLRENCDFNVLSHDGRISQLKTLIHTFFKIHRIFKIFFQL